MKTWKAIVPEGQWIPAPGERIERLYVQLADVCPLVRDSNKEIARLHRRLWESRRNAAVYRLRDRIGILSEDIRSMSTFGGSSARERITILRLRSRLERVIWMEYPR